MTDTQAEDTPLPYPHEEPAPPPVLVYQRSGDTHTLAGGDLTVQDALVAYTEMTSREGARIQVSTAFLSIDASLGLAPDPLLWETVVRGSHDAGVDVADVAHRYATEAAALDGHMDVLRQIVSGLTTPQPSAPPAPEAPADPPAELDPAGDAQS